jgi:hypothetical protein
MMFQTVGPLGELEGSQELFKISNIVAFTHSFGKSVSQ